MFVSHTYHRYVWSFLLALCVRYCYISYGGIGLELIDHTVLAPGLLFTCIWLLLSPDWLYCSMLMVLLLSVFCGLLMLLSSQLLFKTLLCTLLMAQGGYLHLTKAFLRCWSSLWRSSGSVQTVSALWVSVPMTLYLADRLWWLSHCKNWSVCVGLQYTIMERELSASGVTKVSRNGIAPFPWVPSTVSLIAGSMLLIWSRNACLWACCWMTHVSSINL